MDERRKAIRRIHSLERRIRRLFLAAPEDEDLAESVLDHLELTRSAAISFARTHPASVRAGGSADAEVDALMVEIKLA